MKDVHGNVGRGRRELERRSVETNSTADAVSIITFVEDLKKKRSAWVPSMKAFQEGQRALERQRYAFAPDWLHMDQLQGEWNAFNEILDRKDASIQEQLGTSLTFRVLRNA